MRVFTGGVLFSLLLAMKYDTPKAERMQGESSGYPNSDLLKDLVSLIGIDPVNEPSSEVTSRFKTCGANGAGNGIRSKGAKKKFDNRIQTEYALLHNDVKQIIDKYMVTDIDTRKNVTSLMLVCVQKCRNIKEETLLYTNESGEPETREELLGRKKINLPALILGLWHFTVSSMIDNRDGSSLFGELFESHTSESGSEYGLVEKYKKYRWPELELSYDDSTAEGGIEVKEEGTEIVQKDNTVKVENKASQPQTINFNFNVTGDNASVRNIVNNGVYVEGGDYNNGK